MTHQLFSFSPPPPLSRFGPLYLDFSPYYVMFSGWVGDDDPTFPGLESALKSYLQSAWAGRGIFIICLNDGNFSFSVQGMQTLALTLVATALGLVHWVAARSCSCGGQELGHSHPSWRTGATRNIDPGPLTTITKHCTSTTGMLCGVVRVEAA